jgi:putative pyruvate formate lyase activating enzyme
MSQYFPTHRAPRIPLLSRAISAEEYDEVARLVGELGIENGWLQGMDSSRRYVPDFARELGPFLARGDKQ